MSVAPVALCMIVKDEAEHLERCLASVRPYVAEVNVYDTGSTDGTLELLERLVAEPGPPLRLERGEWRDDFSWARAQSFAMASPELDWFMWVDGDDELLGGHELPALVAEAERRGLGAVYVPYGIAPKWNTAQRRLMRRGSGGWEGVVDEYWRMPPHVEHLPAENPIANPGRFRVLHHDYSHYLEGDEEDAGWSHYEPMYVRAAADPERSPRTLPYIALRLAREGDTLGMMRAIVAYMNGVGGPDGPEGRWNPYRVYLCAYAIIHGCIGGPIDQNLLGLIDATLEYLEAWASAAERGETPILMAGTGSRAWLIDFLQQSRTLGPDAYGGALLVERPIFDDENAQLIEALRQLRDRVARYLDGETGADGLFASGPPAERLKVGRNQPCP